MRTTHETSAVALTPLPLTVILKVCCPTASFESVVLVEPQGVVTPSIVQAAEVTAPVSA